MLLSCRNQLPYTEAALHEVMRLSSVIPLSLPHSTICDTTIGEGSLIVEIAALKIVEKMFSRICFSSSSSSSSSSSISSSSSGNDSSGGSSCSCCSSSSNIIIVVSIVVVIIVRGLFNG